jgi:ABC-type antimicrobial peptide transport system permease subunit
MLSFVGLLGFIAGFILGQMVLYVLLRGTSKNELLDSKRLHWKYGTLNWLIALLGMAAAMVVYARFGH